MKNYGSLLDKVAQDIRSDNYDAVRYHFLTELLKRDIIPELPAHWFDEGRGEPFPKNWTASELTIFDNGEIPRTKKKRVRTTKTRYAGKWKAWTATKVKFAREAPWSHLISFFEPDVALSAVKQLAEEKRLDEKTLTLVEAATKRPETERMLLGLVRRQSPKVGTIWLKEHLAFLVLQNDEPAEIAIYSPNASLNAEVEDTDASGKRLTGNAIAQARMATNDEFDRWQNQPRLY